eukprot:scaffold2775_cov343-Prasinococcus_capsulatus_cf.AAC.11
MVDLRGSVAGLDRRVDHPHPPPRGVSRALRVRIAPARGLARNDGDARELFRRTSPRPLVSHFGARARARPSNQKDLARARSRSAGGDSGVQERRPGAAARAVRGVGVRARGGRLPDTGAPGGDGAAGDTRAAARRARATAPLQRRPRSCRSQEYPPAARPRGSAGIGALSARRRRQV